MVAIIVIVAVLVFVGALGAVWERLSKRPHRRLTVSDADRVRAQGTLDYHAKVWDSTQQ